METYTSSRNLYGDLTNNSTATNLTLGDKLVNIALRQILNIRQWFFKEKSDTITTVASQQFYDLLADYGSLINVTVTISSTTYTPLEVTTRQEWDRLNQSSSVTSDIPEFFYIFNNQVGFYPKPSSASNTITINFNRKIVDLSIADYTTGTIVTATNGSANIVGSGTSWTAGMAGKWLKIAPTDAALGGDGRWYEVESIDSATTLKLTRNYEGVSIVAGAGTYILGDVSILPEEFQQLPVFRATEIYFTSTKPQTVQAQLYKGLYQEGLASLQAQFSGKSTDPVVDIGINKPEIINPNLTIEL